MIRLDWRAAAISCHVADRSRRSWRPDTIIPPVEDAPMFTRTLIMSILAGWLALGAAGCAGIDAADISYATPRDGRPGNR